MKSLTHLLRLVVLFLILLLFSCQNFGQNELSIIGKDILFNNKPIKLIGLRCSNALVSDASTDELIAHLDLYKSYGLNTVSVFFMGSRFGDVKGYLPDGSLNPIYSNRMERILRATEKKNMIMIVGCLYWGTSRAKEDLGQWTQRNADTAIANTARWLGRKKFRHIILDPDNEGMAVRQKDWSAESMITAAKAVNPDLIVANNTKQNPANEDLNMHYGGKEEGKPWLDSESTPDNAPGGYWGKYSKETHQADSSYHNYSRIGRYTIEMKENQISKTKNEIEQYNGYIFAGTWIQCSPAEGVNGPFADPGGYSNLGAEKDDQADWNRDIDTIHPDAGILWWLEFVRESFGPLTGISNTETNAPEIYTTTEYPHPIHLR